jgi:hypothetical protein
VSQRFTQGKAGNPFVFSHIHAIDHLEGLHTLPNLSGLVVLTPSATLETGFSRELLFRYEWLCDPANTVILPFTGGRRMPGILGELQAHVQTDIKVEGSLVLDVDVSWRMPLAPQEMAALQAEREAQARAQEEVRPSVLVCSTCGCLQHVVGREEECVPPFAKH